jgi:8-oxo-dGTP diphosphatase
LIKTPHLSADGIIKLYNEQNKFQGIVFIERLNPPHGIALPGGFIDIGEKVEDGLVREMREEVTLDVTIESLLGIYSDPSRDPRFHTASAIYICKAIGTPKAADDAKSIYLFKPDEIPFDTLVFDHAIIMKDFLAQSPTF